MPPAMSDEDSDIDVPDAIPARPAKADPKAADDEDDEEEEEEEDEEEEEEEEEEEDEEEEEEEFQVEKILSHKTERGKIVYRVKWLGWEKEEDQTWEPVDNLENAREILEAYHRGIGGTPQPPSKGKGKGKRSLSTAADSTAGKKRGRKSDANGTATVKDEKLPMGSWEDLCSVAAIIEEHELPDASSTKQQADNKSLVGMLQWNDGRKTQHPMVTLRTKCPQRVLDYYESHLVFKGDPRYVDEED